MDMFPPCLILVLMATFACHGARPESLKVGMKVTKGAAFIRLHQGPPAPGSEFTAEDRAAARRKCSMEKKEGIVDGERGRVGFADGSECMQAAERKARNDYWRKKSGQDAAKSTESKAPGPAKNSGYIIHRPSSSVTLFLFGLSLMQSRY